MNRRTIYIIITVIGFVVVAIVLYLFLRTRGISSDTEVPGAITNPFPFGEQIDRLADRKTSETPLSGSAVLSSGPVQIASEPQAGFVVFSRLGETIVRYVALETGHVFEYTQGAGAVRLSNRTIPRILSAKWQTSGEGALLERRENDGTIRTIRARLLPVAGDEDEEISSPASQTAPYTVEGETLPIDIRSAVLSPDGESIALLSHNDIGATVSILPFNDTQSVELFSSSHRAWNIAWNADKEITFVSKPSPLYIGAGFILDTQNGALVRRGEGAALTLILGPDVASGIDTALVSDVPVSVFNNYLIGTRTVLPFVTYPQEKCTYISDTKAVCAAPDDTNLFGYPHRWYQGAVSFTDDLWLVDGETGAVLSLYNTSVDTLSLDMIHLTYDNSSGVLYFENKRDNSLWMISLSI